MDILLGLLKFLVLLFAMLLVPIVLVVATPLVVLWPRPNGAPWGKTVMARYRVVARRTWMISEFVGAAVPD